MPPDQNAEWKRAQSTIARLEARIAALEQIIALQGDGSVTIQAPGRLKLASVSGIELSTLNTKLGMDATGLRVTCTTAVVSASLVKVEAPIMTVQGIAKSDTVQCNTIVAAVYTPGAGNIW